MASSLRRSILQILLLLVLSLGLWRAGGLILSADAPRPAIVEAASAGQAPASVPLPSGWPLPQLTAPASATPARLNAAATPGGPDADGHYPLNINGVQFNHGDRDSGRLYGIGLRMAGGFEELAAHVESQLGPLGYSEHWNEQNPDGSRGREYISPDRMFVVQIYYWAQSRDCHLEIYAYDSSESGENKSVGKKSLS